MNFSAAIVVAFLVAALGHAAAAPAGKAVRAKVEEPVLEELMGGCSMKCAFPWTVEVVENEQRKPVKVLNDEQAGTAWISSDARGGVGASFRIAFPRKLRREMEDAVPFYGFDIINGNWKSEELWRRHGRVKKARLLYNDRPLCEVSFADSRRWQRVQLPDIMVHSGDVLTFEVLEIYPGEGGGLALSEFVLQGAH